MSGGGRVSGEVGRPGGGSRPSPGGDPGHGEGAGPGGDEDEPVPGALHKRISLTLQGIMLVGLSLAVLQQNWFHTTVISGILVLTALPLVLGRRFDVRIPAEFELVAVLFIFLSLFMGWVHGYYLRFAWWDAALHVGSGLALGVLGFTLVWALNQNPAAEVHMRPGFIAFFAFTFAVSAGALWEIFEYAMDVWFQADMQWGGLEDTMWDLILDAASAAVMAGLGYGWLRSGRDSFLERWIHRFVTENPALFGEDPFAEEG